MSSYLRVAFWGVIYVAACLASSVSSAQNSAKQARPLVNSDAYGRILDTVFPHDVPKGNQRQYSMVLRFMPSDHTESEVVINTFTDGTGQVLFYRVSSSGAWATANRYVQETGKVNVQEIAKLTRVTKEVLPLSSEQTALWNSEMLKSLSQANEQLQVDFKTLRETGETTVFLDGSSYELWFEQGVTKVHWVVVDEEVDDSTITGRSPIAKWMNEVRRYALEHTQYSKTMGQGTPRSRVRQK